MKKILKKILIIIASVVLILVFFFSYGWKLFGFTFCDKPQNVIVSYDEIAQHQYEITFNTSSSYLDYKGYVYKYEEGILYIGARYSQSFFGNAKGTAKETIQVDDDFYKIIVSGSGDEKEIIIGN